MSLKVEKISLRRVRGCGAVAAVAGLFTVPFGLPLLVWGIYRIVNAPRIAEKKNAEIEAKCKAALRSAWESWDGPIHQAEGQAVRMERAMSQGIEVSVVDAHGVATVFGSQGTPYKTSLRSCTCVDFSRRGLPCKHMYALASEALGIDLAASFYRSRLIKPDPKRGLMNMGEFSVAGFSQASGHKKICHVWAADEAGAILAAQCDILPPYEVHELLLPAPNKDQLADARKAGVYVPVGAKAADVQAAIQRREAGDPVTISEAEWVLAMQAGVPLSALAGASAVTEKNFK